MLFKGRNGHTVHESRNADADYINIEIYAANAMPTHWIRLSLSNAEAIALQILADAAAIRAINETRLDQARARALEAKDPKPHVRAPDPVHPAFNSPNDDATQQ